MTKKRPDGTHTVGYGKPPVHSRFKLGQSGNPKGRPKQVRNLSTELRELLNARIVINEGGRRRRVTTLRAGLMIMKQKALKGDMRALDRFFDLAARYNNEPPPPADDEPLSADDEEIISAYLTERIEEGSLSLPRRKSAASTSSGQSKPGRPREAKSKAR